MDKYFHYSGKNVTAQYLRFANPSHSLFFLHTHNFYEMLFFFSGKGVYKIEGSSYDLKPGDILLVRPGEAHYFDIDSSVPYERLVVQFNDELFSSIDPDKSLTASFNNRDLGNDNLYSSGDFESNYYNLCIKNILLPSENRQLQIVTNLLPVLHEILKAFNSKKKLACKDTLIQRVLNKINNDLFGDIDLDSLCNVFFISKAQLCRLFKKETGTTVYNYIQKKRLLAAQRMILDGLPPTEVYVNCGFNDYSSFFRAYKKEYGFSPNKTNRYSHFISD